MSLGIEFAGPNPEPPHTKPRMHNVVPGATSYIYYVSRHCRRLGVEIQCSCKLIDLVFDGDRCTGVIVEERGVKKVYHAATAVIFAAGDFSGNRDMRARFFKTEVVNAEPVNRLSNGDGIIRRDVVDVHRSPYATGTHHLLRDHRRFTGYMPTQHFCCDAPERRALPPDMGMMMLIVLP